MSTWLNLDYAGGFRCLRNINMWAVYQTFLRETHHYQVLGLTPGYSSVIIFRWSVARLLVNRNVLAELSESVLLKRPYAVTHLMSFNPNNCLVWLMPLFLSNLQKWKLRVREFTLLLSYSRFQGQVVPVSGPGTARNEVF